MLGRGGGTFANHDAQHANAEIHLCEKPGDAYNKLFLKVKKGKSIKIGEEIFTNYGGHGVVEVAMGRARFREGGSSREGAPLVVCPVTPASSGAASFGGRSAVCWDVIGTVS